MTTIVFAAFKNPTRPSAIDLGDKLNPLLAAGAGLPGVVAFSGPYIGSAVACACFANGELRGDAALADALLIRILAAVKKGPLQQRTLDLGPLPQPVTSTRNIASEIAEYTMQRPDSGEGHIRASKVPGMRIGGIDRPWAVALVLNVGLLPADTRMQTLTRFVAALRGIDHSLPNMTERARRWGDGGHVLGPMWKGNRLVSNPVRSMLNDRP